MKFTNKLIVSDIDGTFIDSHSKLVQRNLDAVEYFKANGGLFTIATGRVPESMDRLKPIVDLTNAPCICCNGAFVYDFKKGARSSEIFLDYDKTTELIKEVRAAFPEIGIRISARNGYCVAHLNEHLKKSLNIDKLRSNGLYHEADVDSLPRDGWTRVAFEHEPEILDQLAEYITPKYAEYFSFSKAEPRIFEFQDITATKGTAIARLRSELISSAKASESLKIYAIGDYGNDVDMLRHCDVPACPANAIPAVKAVAKLHLCSCDDGAIGDLVEAIEQD
ncbi:MAG: HAD-IIB family hydrolase [Clostridiales bacterium]|nr:HAD-IIB family hydrolase [Clostridiales bacterium]